MPCTQHVAAVAGAFWASCHAACGFPAQASQLQVPPLPAAIVVVQAIKLSLDDFHPYFVGKSAALWVTYEVFRCEMHI